MAFPISCGVSKAELAVQVGETSRWVTRQLDALEVEIWTNGQLDELCAELERLANGS